MRLVYLSPPVFIRRIGRLHVAHWKAAKDKMPFRYQAAPVLIDNHGHTDFPRIKRFLFRTRRDSLVAKFSSRFRSRKKPLPLEVAEELVAGYEKKRDEAPRAAIADSYVEAMPDDRKMKIDPKRKQAYDSYLRIAKRGC